MTVEQIKTHEPNQSLVEQCEDLLKDAKSGKIQGIIGAVIHNDSSTSEYWVPAPNSYHVNIICDRMIGCLERIKYQLLSYRHGVTDTFEWTES